MEITGVKVLLCAKPFKCTCGTDLFQVFEDKDYKMNTFTCNGCQAVYAHSGRRTA